MSQRMYVKSFNNGYGNKCHIFLDSDGKYHVCFGELKKTKRIPHNSISGDINHILDVLGWLLSNLDRDHLILSGESVLENLNG